MRHSFAGSHALGGSRTSREAFRRWLERLDRLFPQLNFDLDDVLVAGPPWNRRIAVSWTDHGRAADGARYRNRGVHLMRVRWGRLTELTARLDTQHLARVLDRMADAGIEEAAAAPIEQLTR